MFLENFVDGKSSSERLKEIRGAAGLSRKAFSEYFGIPYNIYIQWELGRRNPPEYVLKLLDFATGECLIGRSPNKP